jgi:hypothetical protein
VKFLKKKVKECFFCKVNLSADNSFTLQYSSADGVHTATMCGECSKTFDELADLKDRAYGQGFDSI